MCFDKKISVFEAVERQGAWSREAVEWQGACSGMSVI